MKESGAALFAEDKKRLESQVEDAVVIATKTQEKLGESELQLELMGKKIADLEREKKHLEQEVIGLEQKTHEAVEGLKIAKNDYYVMAERLGRAEVENESLKERLDAMPTREKIVDEFKTSSEMQKLLELEVKKFKVSDEYVNNLRAAVSGYKSSSEYREELKDLVTAFSLGPEFKKAVGEKAGQMLPYTIECCRDFFKGNPLRSRDEFGAYFLEWQKQMVVEKARSSAEKASCS